VVSELRVDWDARKEADNTRKHGVSFEEAAGVFSDEHALLLDDPGHSNEEERYILMGLSPRLRILVVVRAHHEPENVIRLISARRANKRERAVYNRRWQT
jgi:uncharacterized DUF497 family protein